MKKLTALVCIACITASSLTKADTILGGYIGAQAWAMGLSGGVANQRDTTDFSFDDKTNVNLHAALEHPIPLVPNIKVARLSLGNQGVTRLSNAYSFGGQLYRTDTAVQAELDLSQTDITLYYEILDNDLISADVGLTARQLDGNVMVSEVDGNRQSSTQVSGVLPMLYGKLKVGLPITSLGLYVEGNYLSIDEHSISDLQAGIIYNFAESFALDMDLQLGYRQSSIDLEDLDNLYSELDFSGIYLGLEFDF